MRIGSGRNENFFFIEGLRKSEVLVLQTLFDWDYSDGRADYDNIALKTSLSPHSVYLALKYLSKVKFVVKQSLGKSWFIVDGVKERILKELNPEGAEPSGEQADEKV